MKYLSPDKNKVYVTQTHPVHNHYINHSLLSSLSLCRILVYFFNKRAADLSLTTEIVLLLEPDFKLDFQHSNKNVYSSKVKDCPIKSKN